MTPNPASPAPPARRARRWWLAIPLFLVVSLALGLGIGRLMLGRIVRSRAANLGIELDFDSLELGLHEVAVSGATFALAGGSEIQGQAALLRFRLDGFSVVAAEAKDARLVLQGQVQSAAALVSTWPSGGAG